MINGEAISHNVQFDDCTGAVSAPVRASIAHLNVNGTDRVASLATSSSTTDQTTRILRSTRSPGQIYGHRWTSVPIRVACSMDLLGDGASPAPRAESVWAIEGSLGRKGAPLRRACFYVFLHSARHIEGLTAAYTLAGSNSFAICRHLRIDSITSANPLRLDGFTLQCHMADMNKPNMNKIKTVCVYCGSGPGTNHRFVEAATAPGKILADNGVSLVYGGGSNGLMGAIAKSTLDHGGNVIGIIPEFLIARENAMARVQELIVTPDMHERKRMMFERSDAFVALPGGVGTLEELVEQLTWQQLGRHTKPVLLANIDGFWEPLLALLAHMRATEFIRPSLAVEILKAERVQDILPSLRAAAARAPEGTEQMAPEIVQRL